MGEEGGRVGGGRREGMLRYGSINILLMYNNDGGKGGARGCEAHEVR